MIFKGTEVKWKWGKRTATGKVKDTFDRKISISTKGANVTRNGSPETLALFIQQENGTELLKLESEVEPMDE